jgi:hypothetical protein
MTLTANDLPWKPDKNKPVSRLLFDDKISQRIKIKPKDDSSHYYYCTQAIYEAGILPDSFSPPIRMVKISMDGDKLVYRATIWHTDKNKGELVYKAFVIEVISDTEFIFTPPLSFPEL